MRIAAGICIYTNENVTLETSGAAMSCTSPPARSSPSSTASSSARSDAKRAVAIALRNRWRRQQLDESLREEVLPKNILMIGPTGCGKTEIARRLARLAQAPFLKVEATKFTEVGYVGRDVEQHRPRPGRGRASSSPASGCARRSRAQAELDAEERVLDALVGTSRQQGRRATASAASCATASSTTRRSRSRCSESGAAGMPTFDIPGMPGAQMGMLNLGEMFGKAFGGDAPSASKLNVAQSYDVLIAEESDKLLDQEQVTREALPASRAERHRLPRRDRQDQRPRGPRRRATSAARACSATCCR